MRLRAALVVAAASLGAAVYMALCVAQPTSAATQVGRKEPPAEFLLSNGRAGQVQIGMPVEDVYRRFGASRLVLVDLASEGYFTPALQLSLPGAAVRPSMNLVVREWPCLRWAVWSLRVLDPRFRTKEGLGIGSTLKELRESLAIDMPVWADGRAVVAVRALGLTFVLDTGTVPPAEGARVISVFAYADPEAVRKERCPELGPIKLPSSH